MYKAIVCTLKVREFPNADRLLLGNCLGNQVVVGLDTPDGALGVFFPTDGQLSERFCAEHNLVGFTDPATGKRVGGYFAANRRVRAQKFRGERSDGFWVPISYLAFTGYALDKLRAGDMFDALNGVPICNKYVTQATAQAQGKQKGLQSRRETVMFKMHFETDQFRYFAESIPAGALITLTEKLHGTSHRVGNVLETRALWPWVERWNALFPQWALTKKTWAELHGSRRVILDGALTDGFYGEPFRLRALAEMGMLRKGETVYGEIVGWVSDSKPIMEPQDTNALKDKAISQRYGPQMVYAYGLPAGQCRLYVYRITQTNEDGQVVELSHQQMVARSGELGLLVVPVVAEPFIYDGKVEALRALVERLSDGPSTLDDRHIREGVCVRVEHARMQTIYKNKSFAFGVLEGYVKEREEVVDAEEAA